MGELPLFERGPTSVSVVEAQTAGLLEDRSFGDLTTFPISHSLDNWRQLTKLPYCVS